MLKIRVKKLYKKGDEMIIHVNHLQEYTYSPDRYNGGNDLSIIELKNPVVIQELLNYSFSELQRQGYSCIFPRQIAGFDCEIFIRMKPSTNGEDDPDRIRKEKLISTLDIAVNVDAQNWTRPYSVRQLLHKLKELSSLNTSLGTQFHFDYFKISTRTPIKELHQQMGPFIDGAVSYTESLVTKAISLLKAEVEEDVLTTFFQFPPALKTAMKQYLVYFAQFLLDLGIEAETEIREELNETLFKVIPKDKDTSLERIYEALAIYLNLPGMPDAQEEVARSGDIAAMQLQANILHLQSQVTLSKALLQTKDATIQAQEATITSLQLTNYQLLDANRKHEAEKKSTEDLIPGVVSVEKVKWKGFSLNLPELLRRLKRRP